MKIAISKNIYRILMKVKVKAMMRVFSCHLFLHKKIANLKNKMKF